jgi:hypothetical protein
MKLMVEVSLDNQYANSRYYSYSEQLYEPQDLDWNRGTKLLIKSIGFRPYPENGSYYN